MTVRRASVAVGVAFILFRCRRWWTQRRVRDGLAMSERWRAERAYLASRIEYHGPPIQWPIREKS